MRAFLVLTLFAALVLVPASFPNTAAGSAPLDQAQSAPGADARGAAAGLKGYTLKDIRWSYSNQLPAEWTDADIVARGKEIMIPNPSTDTGRGAIRVSLGLPDRITIGQEFMVEAQAEAYPDATNISWFYFAHGDIAYPLPYTEAQRSQKLSWFERSYWTPNGPKDYAWPCRTYASPGYQNAGQEYEGTCLLPDWRGRTVLTMSVYDGWQWRPKYLHVDVVYEEIGDLNVSFAEPVRVFQVSESQVALMPKPPLRVKVGVKAVVMSTGKAEFNVFAWFGDQTDVILKEFYELAPANINNYGRLERKTTLLKFDGPGRKTIYFERSSAVPSTGYLEAYVHLDPGETLPEAEANRSDNLAGATSQIWETRWGSPDDTKLRLASFEIGNPSERGRRLNQDDILWLFFPLNAGQVEMSRDQTYDLPSSAGSAGQASGAAGARMSVTEFYYYYMRTLVGAARNHPNNLRLIGYLPADWFSSGPGPEAFRADVGFSLPGARLVLVADQPLSQFGLNVLRELGHSLGLSYRDDVGMLLQWVPDGMVLPVVLRSGTQTKDGEVLRVMSYMARERKGVSIYSTRGDDWNTLATNWGLPAAGQRAASSTSGEVVQVSGSVTPAGTGQLEAAYRMASGITDTATPGPYAVALVDGAGHDLATFSFPVSFTPEWAHGASLESVPFSFVLPWQAGTARIVLRRGGVELAALAVTASAPAVTLIAPNGGALSGQQEISWTGADVDGGGRLLYTVQYSPDGGANWTLLAADLDATTLSWDTSRSPGSTDGRIRVTATDGVNTGSDMSDAGFSLANHPPAATIALPAAASTFLQGYGVALSGWGFDLEDGPLGDDRLTWRSDRDGVLGNGAELTVANVSPGSHVLTLTARDSQGAEASATTNVTIITAGQPDVRLATDAISFLPDAPVAGRAAGVFVYAANVITDTLCTFEFYNGDPAAGGVLIDSQPARLPPDAPKSVMGEWQPATPGSYTIFARVSGCNPPESNTANNSASKPVTVAAPGVRSVYLPILLR